MSLIETLQHYPLLFDAYVFIVGLLVGSFLNVVIYRMPIMMERDFLAECRHALANSENEDALNNNASNPSTSGADAANNAQTFNLFVPRSHCPACNAPIRAWQNIPVVSYILQKGRCSHCSAHISIRYPVIEITTAIISLIVALHFGVSMACLGALLLSWALIALSVIDYEQYLLPDTITLPFLWLGLWFNFNATFVPLKSAVIGAMAGYLSLWTVYWLFKWITKKEGMGYGDFKLLAMLGAWMGWKMLPVIVILSSFVGAVVGIALVIFAGRDHQKHLPFGPYLAAAGWLCLFWGDDILRHYLSTF